MPTLFIAIAAGLGFIVAYHTYGRWLGAKIFNLSNDNVCPSHRLRDDTDYVPTPRAIVFGHHFTSIAGTGPIVGPAIAVMWGWLPALLWVVFGSIFIGAVHDLGSLAVSLRNNGQTVGDIAGRVLNPRVRMLFLLVLFMALTIVLAIFGLVIAVVFRQYPSAIFPVWIQIPIAVAIGVHLHRKGKGLLIPSILALAVMYLTVVFGDQNSRVGIAFFDDTIGGALHAFNMWAAGFPTIVWVMLLLVYSYIASVLPVWTLLQPRDYINSLQLISALGLIVVGLIVAAAIGGAPPVEGATRVPLEIAAPMWNFHPKDAPAIFPFLFITVACGAISGFHCLVSSGTSSKQLEKETDARFVGYGSMLTEGFLATLVILACVAGLGLGVSVDFRSSLAAYATSENQLVDNQGQKFKIHFTSRDHAVFLDSVIDDIAVPYEQPLFETDLKSATYIPQANLWLTQLPELEKVPIITYLFSEPPPDPLSKLKNAAAVVSDSAWKSRYQSWTASGGLARTVSAFVDGAANFLKAMGFPGGVATALMGVLVASFAGTTLDTSCRLQRYVVQEIASTFAPRVSPTACAACGYDLSFNTSGQCPECGHPIDHNVTHTLSSSEPGRVAPPPEGNHNRPDTGRLAPAKNIARGFTWNPFVWLTNMHGATIFAVVIAAAMASLPAPGNDWSWKTAGGGGMILWPLFGATNQLLGGLAFLVIAFHLWRRKKPIFFLVIPLVFMLIMPAWAMLVQLPQWLQDDSKNWALIFIAAATLALEAWMIIEAILLFPRVRGVVEARAVTG